VKGARGEVYEAGWVLEVLKEYAEVGRGEEEWWAMLRLFEI